MRPGGTAGVVLIVVAAIAEANLRHRGMGPLNGAIAFGLAGAGAGAVAGGVQGGVEEAIIGLFAGLMVGASVGVTCGALWWICRKVVVSLSVARDSDPE